MAAESRQYIKLTHYPFDSGLRLGKNSFLTERRGNVIENKGQQHI
jgi:hypothetical protein